MLAPHLKQNIVTLAKKRNLGKEKLLEVIANSNPASG
jgi:hypothetical protein